MINILLSGITGKMGHEIIKEVKNHNDFIIKAGISRNNIENEITIYNDVNMIKEKIDVIIDFSHPDFTLNILDYAKKRNIPMVIGTTGFDDLQLKKINEYSKYIPIFKSSNMSYEINLICDILSKYSSKIGKCDIEIVETHHKDKKDSPSGTALMIANTINESLNNKYNYLYGRGLSKEKRKDNEITIHSIRGGSEMGKHSILFLMNNESIEITHNVTSRSVFAAGALEASKFIINKENGLYDMKDLINEGENCE